MSTTCPVCLNNNPNNWVPCPQNQQGRHGMCRNCNTQIRQRSTRPSCPTCRGSLTQSPRQQQQQLQQLQSLNRLVNSNIQTIRNNIRIINRNSQTTPRSVRQTPPRGVQQTQPRGVRQTQPRGVRQQRLRIARELLRQPFYERPGMTRENIETQRIRNRNKIRALMFELNINRLSNQQRLNIINGTNLNNTIKLELKNYLNEILQVFRTSERRRRLRIRNNVRRRLF